ncbi:MAG: bifunctional nuclease family protein [Chloroflexi bacterium]|nr:bifunctional nuclease family protein [Chloroflexota bacterium]MCY3697012.1 bifunctional nuclease family protein [Chloroflexota bacterium]MXX79537.1 bifunctional nuclease family protein [Chloroflexota bacterium]MYB23153.1 bifunctional nuclease family protein [Chloroflexota bacterium]MYF22196.1 bifunctional nuclease family protein [Chloroflexota bacterium]
MKEVTIEALRVSLMNYNRVVVLKEKDADRYLTIYIGAAEADAIAIRLQDVSVQRPMTHDLMTNVMQELGASVTRVVVTEVRNDTYYARVFLDVNNEQVEIDSRPSDAIALAVRAEAPIFVEDAVIDQAGVLLDDEGLIASEDADRPEPVKPEELEKMSAFRDFIESLDMDDFE